MFWFEKAGNRCLLTYGSIKQILYMTIQFRSTRCIDGDGRTPMVAV